MRIDREGFSRSFEDRTREEVSRHPEMVAAVEQGDWSRLEAFISENLFDKPDEFWNADKLRQAYGVDRRLPLKEILQKVFGVIDHFASRSELAEDDFQRFLSTPSVDATKVNELRSFFTSYLLHPDLRVWVDAGDFAKLATDPRVNLKDLRLLGEAQRKLALDYIKDNIVVNRYYVS